MNSMDDVKQLLVGIKFGSAPIQPVVTSVLAKNEK